jgi:serine protease Do
VVDALLTSGGSGSPVLAVSCKTGELELVGIFHAHYNAASALNVVIGVDQVRDLMTTLQRSVRHADPVIALDAPARTHLVDAIRSSADPPFFPFGPLVASVAVRGDGELVFAVYPSDFPHVTRPLLVLEDAGAANAFGAIAHAYIGLHPYAGTDADTQAILAKALDALRRDAIATLALRSAPTPGSRDAYQKAAARRRSYDRMIDGQRDLAQSLDDLAGKAQPDGPAVTLDQLLH